MGLNPNKAEVGWLPVVVGGAFYTGLGLMRNLTRRGVTTCCIDNNDNQPAFRSIYGSAHRCPNPDHRPEEWLEFMIGLSRKLGQKPVFIPTADRFVSATAKYADELQEHYVFHRKTIDLQALLATKQRQYELADAHGMPIPRTCYVQSEAEVDAFAAVAQFPCLLKPLQGAEWQPLAVGHPFRNRKLTTAATPADLAAAYKMAAEINPRVVVQEVIEGLDTVKSVYLSCYGRDGSRIASCVVRELRTNPINYGSASVVEPIDDPEIDSLCDRFLRSIGYVGLCEIEVKRDTRDGRVKMIETNPRYTGTSDAAPYAGVDLGWVHYLDVIGREVAPVSWDGRDYRHIALHRDFSSIGMYRREGLETWRSILRSYRRPRAFYDFDPRDWRVATQTVFDLSRMVVGSVVRKVFPKRRPGP